MASMHTAVLTVLGWGPLLVPFLPIEIEALREVKPLAPSTRLVNGGGEIGPGTPRDLGRGVPTPPGLSRASQPGLRGTQRHLSVLHPCAQPHLALDVEDEDGRGRHDGCRRP